MWVLADLQATTQEQVALSDVLDKPEQFETIEQGHVIRLNLKGDMKSDYDRDYINVHLVSSIDALVLKSILEKDPRFIEDEGGEHFTISVESPFGQALIGKTKGESVQFVGGHGDTYKARVAGEDDAIQLSDLFNIFIAEENT
jgi:transcription elongation GreA/GreB family factor